MCNCARVIYCTRAAEQDRAAFDKPNGQAAVGKDLEGLSLPSSGLLPHLEVTEHESRPLLHCCAHTHTYTHNHTRFGRMVGWFFLFVFCRKQCQSFGGLKGENQFNKLRLIHKYVVKTTELTFYRSEKTSMMETMAKIRGM